MALERIYKQYETIAGNQDVRSLVDLDQELRQLMNRPEQELERTTCGAFHSEYSAIGVSIGHYSDRISYSGKLLSDAHALNPNSPFRKYTLYSTASCSGDDCYLPNVDSAKAYLKEFPTGPFIYEVYNILSDFYDDLAKVLYILVYRRDEPLLAQECYLRFVTSEPLPEQFERAKDATLNYHQLASDLFAERYSLKKTTVHKWTPNLTSWHFCGD